MNRASAAAAFGPDAAVPLVRQAVHVGSWFSNVAADGPRVGVLFGAMTEGGMYQLFYRTSADAGRTFGAPVAVVPPVAATSRMPSALLVRADGRVNALYASGSQLLAVRSLDHGATWSAPFALGATYAGWGEEVQLVAGDGNTVHAAWLDYADRTIKAARSADGGLTFTISVVESDPLNNWNTPALHRISDRLLLTYASYYNVYSRSSTDGGVTWSSATQLNGPVGGYKHDLYWYFTRLVSDGGPTALAIWSECYAIVASRWDGSTWSAPFSVTPPGTYVWPEHLRAVEPVSGTVVVTWDELDFVYGIRSTDGGLTFGAPQWLDSVVPDPDAYSQDLRLVTDGQGRAWVAWNESGTNANPTVVLVRYSGDAGATWGPLYRLDRETLGGRSSRYFSEPPFAASNGTLYATFVGQRASIRYETLFNVYDTSDFDRDGAPAASDCNELDPGVWALPPEVGGLTVQPTQLAWSSVSAESGGGTVYDLVDGSAAQLRTSAFGDAACLASAHAGTTLLDAAVPAPGDARYVLVRAHNTCGRGTWGHSTLDPDPRNALDAAPCP